MFSMAQGTPWQTDDVSFSQFALGRPERADTDG